MCGVGGPVEEDINQHPLNVLLSQSGEGGNPRCS